MDTNLRTSNKFKELLSDAVSAAPKLLGCRLVRHTKYGVISGIIVETETYNSTDAASHTYRGQTSSNAAMFGPYGHAYVYFTYGMHYCFNVVCGPKGSGEGVLIRALEPIEGLDIMRKNRKLGDIKQLTNGPAKLCQALSIDKNLSGHDLSQSPLELVPAASPLPQSKITQTTRIGIKNDAYRLWRFYIKNSLFVSKV